MADVKISALPASSTPLAGTEILPIVQSATTRQVSVANLTAGRAVNALSLTASSLTSGRVPYATTAGLLTDSANLLYSGTDLTVYGVRVGRGGGAISSNTVVGSSAGNANTSGTELTYIGQQAGNSNLSGVSNVAVGNYASSGQTTGSYNSSLGVYAGYGGDGSNNTSVGYFTLFANITGNNNTVLGSQALISNNSGSNNTVVGYASGSAITSGSKNTIIGSYTGSAAPISATGSNFIVLSDGDGNIVASSKTAQTFALQGGTLSSGTGIAFPATQNASSNAKTLDDYEEGTWTPNDQSGASLSFTVFDATYTKIGRLVQVQASITYPSTASTLDAQIGGLPFTAASGTDNTGGICFSGTNANLSFTGLIARNNTKFFLETIVGAAVSNLNMSSKYIKFFGSYIV
jgi:hypothetical protein